MSTRIKSAAVAIVIAVILLIAHGTFLFNIAVGAISALAIYEIFRATKMTEHKYQTIACCAFAFVDAFMPVLAVLFQLQALHGAFRYSNVSALS